MWPATSKVLQILEVVKYAGKNYIPVDGDRLPSYFYSMLDDIDRTLTYSEAIRACIQELKQKTERVVVVDIGVGTGLLSALCIHHGADFVVGVDVNEAALSSTKSAMNTLEFAHKFTGVQVTATANTNKLLEQIRSSVLEQDLPADKPFNMVVSEILGTFVFGESMHTYLQKYLPMVAEVGGRLHAVPMTCKQHFALYEFNVPISVKHAAVHALGYAARQNMYLPTDKGGLSIGLHLYPYTKKTDDRTIYMAEYKSTNPVPNPIVSSHTLKNLKPDPEKLTLGVFEWTCELWTDIFLKNTLDAYQEIEEIHDQRFAFARMNAWGFMVFDASHITMVQIGYTKTAGVNIQSESFELTDVGTNIGAWVGMAADEDAAHQLATMAREKLNDESTTVIWVIDDTTCGMLCLKLLDLFQYAKIRVMYNNHKNCHTVCSKVLTGNSRIDIVGASSGGRGGGKRRILEGLKEKCNMIIIPALCYMSTDYASEKKSYLNLPYVITALIEGADMLPSKDAKNKHTNILVKAAHTLSPNHVSAILDQVGPLKQLRLHRGIHFTTRDYLSLPFWNDGEEIKMNVHQVMDPAETPVSNLKNLKKLIHSKDYKSALARMFGGSGIICRIGHIDEDLEIKEMSDAESSDDSDDDWRAPPKKRNTKRPRKSK